MDSTTLGPLPTRLRPEGNAYWVAVTYLLSDAQAKNVTTPTRALDITGSILRLWSPSSRPLLAWGGVVPVFCADGFGW